MPQSIFIEASLVAQLVKNPPAMRETWVPSLLWKDSLEEGMATHSSVLAWRIPMDRGAWQATVHGLAKSGRRLSTNLLKKKKTNLSCHSYPQRTLCASPMESPLCLPAHPAFCLFAQALLGCWDHRCPFLCLAN